MTFSVSVDEWWQGYRAFARSRNRFAPWTPYFLGSLALLFGFGFWFQPDFGSGALCIGMIGALLLDCLWLPAHRKRRCRRQCGGDWSAPVTYEFSSQGFTMRTATGEWTVEWASVSARLEGQSVWVLVVPIGVARLPEWRDDRKSQLLFLSKRATQTPEGAREWAVVDAHFARPASPPIASPGS